MQHSPGPADAPFPAEATDSLTGLLRRDALLAALERAATPEGGGGQPFALLALDLDRFKSVNDTLGHAVGDALLRAVGRRIRTAIRDGDAAGRIGGDEFAILMTPPAGEVSASALAARVVELLGRPFLLDGHSVVTGASVGIALYPADAAEPEALLRCADLALYQAKQEGRGDLRRFQPALRARAEERRRTESELRAAIALGQFELHYQPHVELDGGRLAGFEALLRWRHPARGLVAPAEFVPLAEETGLILPIGEWVLRTACREAAGWSDPSLVVAVNVAAAQLARRELEGQVRAALAASGLAPQRLELEVTETALLQDTATAEATCARLRALGVRVSLDDFGTGYSSLTRLRSFPLDRVKIDRSFVSGVATEPESAAIVRAVAALGQSLGLRTTAEGVETPTQRDALSANGCTDAQGYLFSEPVPAASVDALIRRIADGRRAQDDKAIAA
ncbi:bifunctional diguanylate cyclase/phosphodiesterase [Roseomonas sp. AR75]|uniref:putative bifunctional diguanylate cyclase/phosphodiesterase n=1 Tax=Roseomonas sp. AR75 TaxID=2562311 RepID=UPI001484DD15|nr:EAL domain-containing protein [Roseomonas sp. AR75]